MTSPKDALPRRKLLRVRVLTSKGNRYLVPLQGAEEQSQAPEEDVQVTAPISCLPRHGAGCRWSQVTTSGVSGHEVTRAAGT